MEEKVWRKTGRRNRGNERREKEIDHMQSCVYGFVTSVCWFVISCQPAGSLLTVLLVTFTIKGENLTNFSNNLLELLELSREFSHACKRPVSQDGMPAAGCRTPHVCIFTFYLCLWSCFIFLCFLYSVCLFKANKTRK